MDIPAVREFWIKQTGIPAKQFYKDQIRPVRLASFSYPESFRKGTCKIYINGRKESMELMLSIKAFLDTYSKPRA